MRFIRFLNHLALSSDECREMGDFVCFNIDTISQSGRCNSSTAAYRRLGQVVFFRLVICQFSYIIYI